MTSVADTVALKIEQLIADGVLKSGQTLPSERRLSEKLNASRSAIREGLKILRAREIINTQQGRRSVVANISKIDPSPLLHLYSSQPRTLYDLFEVRALLESEAAKLAAERGTKADFYMIQRRYDEMCQGDSNSDVSAHAHWDHAFHLAISEASHNPILVHTLQSLTDLLLSSVFACVNNLYHREQQKHDIDCQHKNILDAVLSRDPLAAQQAARLHIESVKKNLNDIEQEEERVERAALRISGWG